jgi:hypothetical protein
MEERLSRKEFRAIYYDSYGRLKTSIDYEQFKLDKAYLKSRTRGISRCFTAAIAKRPKKKERRIYV